MANEGIPRSYNEEEITVLYYITHFLSERGFTSMGLNGKYGPQYKIGPAI
jgi:hypothetical protein